MLEKKSLSKKRYSCHDIVLDLKSSLSVQKLSKDTKIPSASELKERYNVSMATMNRALDELVKKGLLYRKRGSGTFVAKNASVDNFLNFCIISPRMKTSAKDPYHVVAFSSFYTTILEEIQNLGHKASLVFLDNYGSLASVSLLMNFDAIIMPAGFATVENNQFLKALKVPVILTHAGSIASLDFAQVYFDYHVGFIKLFKYLLSKNYRKFLIAGLDGYSFEERSKAVCSATKELNIASENLIFKSVKNYTTIQDYYLNLQQAQGLGEYIYNNNHLFDVIISLSDYASFGIIKQLRGYGWEPGCDYAIASYDNYEAENITLHSDKPILTAITHPLHSMAIEAAHLAVDEVLNPINSTRIVRVSANELVIRSSTELSSSKINIKRCFI